MVVCGLLAVVCGLFAVVVVGFDVEVVGLAVKEVVSDPGVIDAATTEIVWRLWR